MSNPYDSVTDTLKHARRVGQLMGALITDLVKRSQEHDHDKTDSGERGLFNKYTPLLAELEYGSLEYREALKELAPALEIHYAKNRHHPEHFRGGVNDMTLVDLLEMLCDWKAASERVKNGSIERSLSIGEKRFSLSPQLAAILHNTVVFYGLDEKEEG